MNAIDQIRRGRRLNAEIVKAMHKATIAKSKSALQSVTIAKSRPYIAGGKIAQAAATIVKVRSAIFI